MKKISWWFTKLGESERDQVVAAFDQRRFSMGPVVETFEARMAELLGVPYAVATNSGTSALIMSLMAADVGPGDEVIVPDLTWIATAQAAALLGAKVVVVDCEPDSPVIDPQAVRAAVTDKTKAIIPVHFHGRACDLTALGDIARDCGAVLIEDACKAMASEVDEGCLGGFGDFGCYSLGMISLVSVGYGGVVVTRNEESYQRLLRIRDHGVVRGDEEAYACMGSNFKISDLLAAIGIAQVDRVPEKKEHLNAVYRRYAEGLSGISDIQLIELDIDTGKVPLVVDVCLAQRDELCAFLAEEGVETAKFHLPLHDAPYISCGDDFPHADRYARQGVMLPCGPSQPLENVDRTLELIRRWHNRKAA